jgi:hypothetical protein
MLLHLLTTGYVLWHFATDADAQTLRPLSGPSWKRIDGRSWLTTTRMTPIRRPLL